MHQEQLAAIESYCALTQNILDEMRRAAASDPERIAITSAVRSLMDMRLWAEQAVYARRLTIAAAFPELPKGRTVPESDTAVTVATFAEAGGPIRTAFGWSSALIEHCIKNPVKDRAKWPEWFAEAPAGYEWFEDFRPREGSVSEVEPVYYLVPKAAPDGK
jgi:hypothetical protein